MTVTNTLNNSRGNRIAEKQTISQKWKKEHHYLSLVFVLATIYSSCALNYYDRLNNACFVTVIAMLIERYIARQSRVNGKHYKRYNAENLNVLGVESYWKSERTLWHS